MISESTVETVKASMNIVEVVGGFLKLKKHGKDFICNCPFHNEKSPSFTVSSSRGIYKCFGCGKSGDTIAFLMEHQKMSYVEAITWIAEKNGILIEQYEKKEFVKPIPRLEKLSKKMIEWFDGRKISNNTLLRFGVTEAREWMPQFEQETPVICFNYFREESLVNIKFRGPKKAFKMAKDAELIFYNIDSLNSETECVIVEGEVDALSAYEAGFTNVVSVPNGASPGKQNLDYLNNCWKYFTQMKKIILAVDNDSAGKSLQEELCRRLGKERCFQVKYPEGCKDLNDVLVKSGKDQVKEILDSSTPWPIEGMVSMDDMYSSVIEYYEDGYPKGAAARIYGFDELLTFYPGQLTVITGVPGSGKSEFVDYLMTSLSQYHGWHWGVSSFETQPVFHVTKLVEKFTNKAFGFRKNKDQRVSPKELEYAIGMIDKYFHFIDLNLVNVTMDGLIEKAEELVFRYGIKGILFDPWNCIEHKYEESETKYVLTCLNKLIAFLEKYQVHGFLVAHPTKLQKDKVTKKYDVPTLYNISGSAHFFNRTHNGLSIARDFQTNVVDVYVQKVKCSWLGKIGYASFNYDVLTRQYLPCVPATETNLPEGLWSPLPLEL